VVRADFAAGAGSATIGAALQQPPGNSHLGYFDALASGAFKRTTSGKMAFYPWGKVGKGYEIPTEAQHREIHRFIVRYYMVVLPVATGAAIFLKWIALLALPLIIIPYILRVRRWTRSLPTTDERLTARESFEAQAVMHSPVMLWVLLVISLVFVVGGAAILISGGDVFAGLSSLLFFGCCAGVFAFMIAARRRLKRNTGPSPH